MSSEIICVIDRSGSMNSMAQEAIGGFNQFLKEQKALPDDKCKFSLILFDHDYNKIYDAEDIQSVSELNDQTYVPRGTTALYDALGRALDEAIERIQIEYSERPRVAVMVMTDGQENASKDYSKERLERLVKDLKKDGWQFIFMSSDLSSFNNDLGSMTLDTMTVGYTSTAKGYNAAYASAGQSVGNFRSKGIVDTSATLLNEDGSQQQLKIIAKKNESTSKNT